jgi:hypothetical protein
MLGRAKVLPVPNVRTLTKSLTDSFLDVTSKGSSLNSLCCGCWCCCCCWLLLAAALIAAACNGWSPGGVGCACATVAAMVPGERMWCGC